MNLEDVYGHAPGGGELLVTDMALEVLGLLVLHQNLLVLKLPVAVVTPHLRRRSLLLLSHFVPSLLFSSPSPSPISMINASNLGIWGASLSPSLCYSPFGKDKLVDVSTKARDLWR